MDKNIKMISAKLALPYIKDNMIVGLGGGTTMGYVVNFLEKKLSFCHTDCAGVYSVIKALC